MFEFNKNGIYWLNFFIWKCLLECDGKWDVEIDFFIIIMEISVGNPIENEIPWLFFMYKYWNSIENIIKRLIFFNKKAR